MVLPGSPDTLVVCPAEYRPALTAWMEHRRNQGHEILVADPPSTAQELSAMIRKVATTGRLKFVLLIGDVPDDSAQQRTTRFFGIPTHYVAAEINTRWGSEPMIATDIPYADVDDDGVPDLAIGRIAADSVDELAVALGKVLRYEESAGGDWQQRLNVVAGAGGFGKVTDALIESAGRYVFQQAVPEKYEIRKTSTMADPASALSSDIRSQVHRDLEAGGLAWIYLGHGLPTELDRVRTAQGEMPLLSVNDAADLRCGCRTPLAVLVACYTGAIDASRDSLGEEFSLAPEGPVAVIAASRVTMPYGNTVLGYELLKACFQDAPEKLGEIFLLAQQRTKREGINDPLRVSLDAMCQGLSPPPVDLAAERSEHVWMYHLLGDPLLRLNRSTSTEAAPAQNRADSQIGQLPPTARR